jgi:hypothetical protein
MLTEEIFEKVQNDLENARLIINLCINLCPNLSFLAEFKSAKTKASFLNMLDQNKFNEYLLNYSSVTLRDILPFLDKEKLEKWAGSMNIDTLTSSRFIIMFGILVADGLYHFDGLYTPETLLIKLFNVIKSLPNVDKKEYLKVAELLMYTYPNFSVEIFNNSNYEIAMLATRYYANKCFMLETQMKTQEVQND